MGRRRPTANNTSRLTISLLNIILLQASEFEFEMVHGVTRVWADASREMVVADTPGDSYEFFVDMHRCRVCSRVQLVCFTSLGCRVPVKVQAQRRELQCSCVPVSRCKALKGSKDPRSLLKLTLMNERGGYKTFRVSSGRYLHARGMPTCACVPAGCLRSSRWAQCVASASTDCCCWSRSSTCTS